MYRTIQWPGRIIRSEPICLHSCARFNSASITIANTHCSGVLSNKTGGEYKEAKQAKESRIISIKSHKTADTHSPGCIVLSPTVHWYLQIHVNKLRSQVEKNG